MVKTLISVGVKVQARSNERRDRGVCKADYTHLVSVVRGAGLLVNIHLIWSNLYEHILRLV